MGIINQWLEELFPDAESTWRPSLVESELEIDLSLIKDDIQVMTNEVEQKGIVKEKGNTEERPRKNKKIQAVDTGCAGLLFFRFRVNVKPTEFMDTVFGELLTSTIIFLILHSPFETT